MSKLNIPQSVRTDVRNDSRRHRKIIDTSLTLNMRSELDTALVRSQPDAVRYIEERQKEAFIAELFGPLRNVIQELAHMAMRNTRDFDDHMRITQLRGKAMDHMALDVDIHAAPRAEERACPVY